ncbi:MAG: MarR family winged helix-turn-helix transcriptional regulator [Vicinamibacteria bacterium]
MKQLPDSLGFLLGDISRLMRQKFRAQIEGSSLTPSQAKALIHVSRNEGIRQVDLAEMMEVQPITLARLLDNLVAAGTVERRADPADRRAYRIFLTDAAAPHLAAIHHVADALQADALRTLSKAQAASVMAALRAMRENLSSR